MVPIEIDVTNVVLEGAKRFDEARRDAKIDTGEYGQQIEDVLKSDIFHGIDVNESETSPESVTMPDTEPAGEKEDTSEARAYYSGSGKKSGAKPMLAAAAAIAAIAIGVALYFFMRPDPAGGTADRASFESSLPADTLTVNDDLYQPLEPEPDVDDLSISVEDSGEVAQQPAAPDESEQMQARYEAELEALKQQLQQAQLAAAGHDEAIDKIAELEQQVVQAQDAAASHESTDQPQAQFAVAQLGDPVDGATLSAGGDEAPPLGSPLPATEADQEAGTDFATEMVESAPAPPIPEALDYTPSPVEKPVEEAAVDEPGPLIKAAVIKAPALLRRPKPRYPAAARRLGKEAVVTLRLLIGADGKVVDVERVGTDPGMGFSKAAINAALGTKWNPATRDGEPIEMWASMRITFKP